MIPIVGWQKTSLIDYPRRIATVLFTPGCNFRCPYCHNPQLVTFDPLLQPLPEDALWDHLDRRRRLIDGVVITGGEPTLYGDGLAELIRALKERGFLVKLDTNGTHPELLQRLIGERQIDYVAMDIKTSLPLYGELTGASFNDVERVQESIACLQEMAGAEMVEVEFRTTLHPRLHSEATLREMLQLLEGSPRYVLQTFRPQVTLNPLYQETQAFTEEEMERFQTMGREYVKECLLR